MVLIKYLPKGTAVPFYEPVSNGTSENWSASKDEMKTTLPVTSCDCALTLQGNLFKFMLSLVQV